MSSEDDIYSAPMNPTQVRTFDELLAIGADRPYAPAGLVEELHAKLTDGTAPALAAWTERSMWLSKGEMFAALRCEAGFLSDRESNAGPGTLHVSTAVGTVAHRAIQMTHTHPGRAVEQTVRAAVVGACGEEKFAAFWEAADTSTQSDVIMQATSRVMGFLDSWPPLHPTWAPRFEEPIQAKIGKLTLSGRVDLLLGRPRVGGRQTMMIADWKSNGIKDDHEDEASFYALLATLRFGVPPFRSVIYSLASGEWTDPDITADRLHAAADQVIAAVDTIVATMTESRPPTYTTGTWCNWCSLREICPAANAETPIAS